MNDLSQKTHDAFKAGASFSMNESYTSLTAICLGLVVLIALYVVYCISKGLGDDSIKMKDAPMLILRAVIIIIVVGIFLLFNYSFKDQSMKWITRQNYQRCKNAVSMVTLFMLFGINNVLAKMPELEEPTQGKQSGIMATLQAYAYDGGVFISLLVVAGALFVAAKNCLTEYSNIGEGKGSWGKFGAMAVIGILLVVLCIWLGSLAADTLLN